ncbi:MAG: hypothetical protein JJU45_14020 [Acidimicrobiia bacterium]|nr:hypothetical protein [Acidimicrobiia bacterium]
MVTVITMALVAAVALAITHLLAGKLRLGSGVYERRALSFGGGISVAYVFVQLLPEIAEEQTTLAEHTVGVPFISQHAYLMALVGLVVFYGLERGAVVSRRGHLGAHGPTGARYFAVHLGAFVAYSVLIGYLLVAQAEEYGTVELGMYTVALGVHFVVNDKSLQLHHQHQYRSVGRWLLAAAILCGWALGATVEVSEAALAALFAFLSGGIVLNVLKEELPAESESSFGAFALGAAGYAVLLLAV